MPASAHVASHLRTTALAIALAGVSLFAMPATAQNVSFAAATTPDRGRIVLPVGKGGALSGIAAEADAKTNGAIGRAIAAAKFDGKAGSSLSLYGLGPYDAVALVGVGEGPKTVLDLRQFGGKAAQTVSGWTGADAVRVVIPDAADLARDAAEAALGAKLGSYDFGKWADDTKKDPLNLAFLSGDADAATSFARDQAAVMDGVKLARDLISTPSNIKSPQWFVETTRVAFKDVRNVRIEVLDEREMARLGMGAILGVGQGSTRPPRVLIIRYDGGPAGEAPLAFVGKGITFDTGGISIKPGDGMWRMRYDMSGAAASVGSLLTIAKRGAKVNAVAVSALAENMTDGNAIRPGDVLTSMSGKTIEVLNTDAEGRLVLADGLWLAQERFKPKLAVTIATLTGAVRTALGTNYAGLFSHDDAVAARIEAAAKASGEAVWRLPIHNDVIDAMKTPIADVKNVVEGGTVPGASLGAAFIMEWAKPETAFAHLDIAGMAWTTSANATTPAGAAGYGVLLFDSLTRSYEAEAK